VDGSNTAVVGGYFTASSVSFDSHTLANANPGNAPATTDIFVARQRAAGAWTQAVRVGGAKADAVVPLSWMTPAT
jgi:hypothetical protein